MEEKDAQKLINLVQTLVQEQMVQSSKIEKLEAQLNKTLQLVGILTKNKTNTYNPKLETK